MDTPNELTNLPEPKVDIHYTNGQVQGKFKFKFKQSVFNTIISLVVSGCGVHGVYLHYEVMDKDKTIIQQQTAITEGQQREAAALAQIQLLLTQKSMTFPIPMADNQNVPKPKP